jgi:ketosteroid isomerase-like protein
MAGPYPPEYGAGPVGPQIYPYPDNVPSAYPGMLPPPVQYPKKRRWRLVAGAVVALAVVAGLVAAIVLAVGRDESTGAGTLTEASAKAAIQEYLDAMTNGDDETVARHTLCGLFDAVKERRSDLALAGLSSDAFRKQYSRAEVTSIDKMVHTSPHQAQVLFTMNVVPASSSRGESEEQAVAQLLAQDNEILVCSYLPRTAGQY